jgi:hypothetical protein
VRMLARLACVTDRGGWSESQHRDGSARWNYRGRRVRFGYHRNGRMNLGVDCKNPFVLSANAFVYGDSAGTRPVWRGGTKRLRRVGLGSDASSRSPFSDATMTSLARLVSHRMPRVPSVEPRCAHATATTSTLTCPPLFSSSAAAPFTCAFLRAPAARLAMDTFIPSPHRALHSSLRIHVRVDSGAGRKVPVASNGWQSRRFSCSCYISHEKSIITCFPK